MLSTHQMNEVEEICDRVLMIHKGRSVLYGNLREIKSTYRGHSVYVNTDDEYGELKGVKEKRELKGTTELILDEKTTSRHILDQLAKKNVTVNRFEVATPSLNELFLNIVDSHEE